MCISVSEHLYPVGLSERTQKENWWNLMFSQTPLFKCNCNSKLLCVNYPQQLLALILVLSNQTVESTQMPFWKLAFLVCQIVSFAHVLISQVELFYICLNVFVCRLAPLKKQKTITGDKSHLTKDTFGLLPFSHAEGFSNPHSPKWTIFIQYIHLGYLWFKDNIRILQPRPYFLIFLCQSD